jgi:hypothetical protein
MKLKELKDWMNGLPEECDEYEVILAQIGKIDEEYWFREDEPVIALNIDKENSEVLIMRGSEQTDEEIRNQIDKTDERD